MDGDGSSTDLKRARSRKLAPGGSPALAAVFGLVAGLLAFPGSAPAVPTCPGPIIVDAGGGGDFTTIQAAVNALSDPGPCTINVKAGLYNEAVSITSKNTLAASDANRIVIRRDPSAAFGSVIVTPPANSNGFRLMTSKFITIKGFTITGATRHAIFLDAQTQTNSDITVDSNDINSNGSPSVTGGIGVGEGNTRTWIVNNLIRSNSRNGIEFGATSANSSGKPKYVVNNTLFANTLNGAQVPAEEDVFFINNLFVGNGTVGTSVRAGIRHTNTPQPARQRLLNNMFYGNLCGGQATICDIDPDVLDATDSGNFTTLGTEAFGVVACTFGDCATTHAASEIFASPGTGDFHLKTTVPISPAIDLGLNSFNDGKEWVPTVDFEAQARPANGSRGLACPVGTSFCTDIGFDEVSVPTAVALVSFTATGSDGSVWLEWKTGFEVDNLGFHLYREEGGQLVRLTPSLVAGSALFAGAGTALTAGRTYRWIDDRSLTGGVVRYWLEDVDLNGRRTMHGPVAPQPGGPLRLSVSELARGEARPRQSSLLSEVGRASTGQSPTLSARQARKGAKGNSVDSSGPTVQWAIAAGSAVKLSVREEGWYRVGQPDLVAAGLNAGIDPRLLQLFVDGVEQPMLVRGESDGRFDPGDAIEFYGVGLDTPSTDTRVYWLVVGAGPGKRVKTVTANGRPSGSSGFSFTVERRDRTVYFSALTNGEAENFFGPVITEESVEQALDVQHLDPAWTENAVLEVALQGVTAHPHSVAVKFNGVELGAVGFQGRTRGVATFPVPRGSVQEGRNVVTLTSQQGEADVSLVDVLRLTYAHTYSADEDALKFTATGGRKVTIGGFTSPQIRVVDITSPSAMQEVVGAVKPDGGGYAVTVGVPGRGTRLMFAFGDARIESPAQVAPNQPSAWHQAGPGADLVIITHADFLDSVGPLKTLREGQGLSVAVVDVEDVYDEFSFGAASPWAIRDFLQRARSEWQRPPRYVLFVGDASLDPRNYLGFGDFNFVPTKLVDTRLMETASDGWFADFDGDGVPEMAIGRLPVRTAAEAGAVVAKIVGYAQAGNPGGDAVMVADRNDVADDAVVFDFEAASTAVEQLLPANLTVREIFRGQMGDSAARSDLLARLNAGPLLVHYFGHGSVGVWRGELLESSDAEALTNGSRLPLLIAMTCLNGYFHDPSVDGLAESLLTASRGGAIAVWASSGMTSPEGQLAMSLALVPLLFDGLMVGDAGVQAKGAVEDRDVRLTWMLFGDPLTRLK